MQHQCRNSKTNKKEKTSPRIRILLDLAEAQVYGSNLSAVHREADPAGPQGADGPLWSFVILCVFCCERRCCEESLSHEVVACYIGGSFPALCWTQWCPKCIESVGDQQRGEILQNTIFLEVRTVRVCPRSADQAFLLCNAVDLPQHFQHAPELVGQLVRSIESQASPVHEQERSTNINEYQRNMYNVHI
jgi:hypothetical protein